MAKQHVYDLLPSAARTTDQTVEFVLEEEKGVIFVLDVTANPGAQTLQLNVQIQAGSLGYVGVYAAATVGGNGTTTYLLYPGTVTATKGNFTDAVPLALPLKCRLFVDHSAAGSWTYSVRMYKIP